MVYYLKNVVFKKHNNYLNEELMTFFIDFISTTSPVAQIIMSVAIMLLFGFLLTRLTKLLKLPNVTGYIIAGILIGPYFLNLIPAHVIEGLDFISDIALAFIAFGVGEYFKLDNLKKNGRKIIVLTLFESLGASLLVFIVTYFIFGMGLPFSILLSALASATAPASTIMTIRQTKAKGDYVDTLLQVVALDDVVSLVAYSVAISIALASLGGDGFNFGVITMPILKNILAIIVGGAFGFAMKFLLSKRSKDNRLIIVVCVLFLFCGICALLDVSPLLGCMVIGTVYINVSNDENLFLQVNYFAPPILLLFFVRSGLSFNLSALFSSAVIFGNTPLWLIGIVYFLVRIVGKYLGAFAGSATIRKDKKVRNLLGLGLIPQAGVAIGLAMLGARTIGGNMGDALLTIILASSVLYELVGPACSKLGLYLSGSYSNKLEDIVNDEKLDNTTSTSSEVELLIKRINAIKNEIDEEEKLLGKQEEAFTNAGLESIENSLFAPPSKNKNKRKK